MDFRARLCKAPIPYDREAADSVADLAAGQPPEVRDLLCGTAGCSPYLRGLMLRHASWLESVLCQPPEAVLEAEIAAAQAALDPARAPDQALREIKSRVALLVALADLGGVWALDDVTRALTRLADAACDTAFRHAIHAQWRRGKLPFLGEEDAHAGAGLSVIAMGKMGAEELNYSSDIDLVVLFDETRHPPEHFEDLRHALIRATRTAHGTLNKVTPQGYVFRTDLRLRPDPSVTPVCLSMAAAERYYESFGRTWERAAYIKARAAAVDVAAGAAFLERLAPFVWRRHLDFAAIRDAHEMRLKIRAHKGTGPATGPIALPGHDMKLGRGGIREIEFLAQTFQLIAGGRDPDLRIPRTVDSLAKLADKGWIDQEAASLLTSAYRAHRMVEHRLQMIADAQTHILPQGQDGLARLAAFCGEADTERFLSDLRARLEQVHDVTERFFAPESPQAGDETAAEEAFSESSRDLVAQWPKLPALRSARAREIFKRLRPGLLARLSRATDPDDAVLQFNGFLSGLPAGVQILSMFEANPALVDLLIDICTTSPALARHLAQHSGVLDAVIGGSFFDPLPPVEEMRRDLAERMVGIADFEEVLRALRIWKEELHFRIGVHHLRGLIDADSAAGHYAALAESVLGTLWPLVIEDFGRRHGPPPGRGAMVLAMGSLGAGMLNARSDLDLIVIYDPAGSESSQGQRPLAVSVYYARLTQALIGALKAPMREGVLYDADMRLRPSGRKGPVATALTGFRDYQLTQAWTWEHMALTRARAICGPTALMKDVEAVRAQVLASRAGDREKVREALRDMRRRIDAAEDGAPPGGTGIKTGRGSLQDIALLAQAAALIVGAVDRRATAAQLALLPASGLTDEGQAARLGQIFARLQRVHTAERLVATPGLDLRRAGLGVTGFLCREGGAEDLDALLASLAAWQAEAADIIDAALN